VMTMLLLDFIRWVWLWFTFSLFFGGTAVTFVQPPLIISVLAMIWIAIAHRARTPLAIWDCQPAHYAFIHYIFSARHELNSAFAAAFSMR